jgi:hypothetical protein
MLKTSNVFLNGGKKHQAVFPTVGFLTRQILGIVGSEIKTKRIFSLVGTFVNLRRCHLQTNF